MPTIEERALALVNEVKGCEKWETVKVHDLVPVEALFASLETLDAERAAHALFRQEVSEAVERFRADWQHATPARDQYDCTLGRFIIAESDPLVEVQNLLDDGLTLEEAVVNLGLKLVEVGDAD